MRLFEVYQAEDNVTQLAEPGAFRKEWKIPHDEVESVITQWINQEDHIELSNGMHILSGENHGYDDNEALVIGQDNKILDHDSDIVDLMQQFTPIEIDPSIAEAIVEKCWKGYQKKGMKTMFGKRVPNCVKKEAVEEAEEITSGDRNIALTLPRGEMKVLKAEDDEYDRGLLVKLLDDGGYDMAYWYEKHVPFEVEVLVDGKSIKKDAKTVTMKFHPELDGMMDKVNKFKMYDLEADIKDLRDKLEKAKVNETLEFAQDFNALLNGIEEDLANRKQELNDDLKAWFGKGKKGGAGGGGWDAYNTKGERVGKCGDTKSKAKPKCLSKSKAASLRAKGGKSAIGSAVSKKRRQDPNKNRKGKAKNVSNTKGK
jgi:hypothetical protein